MNSSGDMDGKLNTGSNQGCLQVLFSKECPRTSARRQHGWSMVSVKAQQHHGTVSSHKDAL